ncbi:MAG: sulfite exporter TauE/SafE family protein, partial [Lachnospiraceae bacterium]|nr:sulfite exporter TauE/SafE family protein [Lachnospiraceae bacterium]
MSINTSVPVLTVFLQGLLSFFSPCVLPLLPVYIGYLSGGTLSKDEDGAWHYNRKKVMLNTVFFTIGVSFAFFLLGLGLSAIGRFFSGNQMLFARIGGIIVVMFGLYQLGFFGKSELLSGERRLPFDVSKMTMSPVTALIFGFVLSFSWTPCIGPVLSSVLIMAASAGSAASGFILIGVYTLGYIIPFLLVGVFTTSLLEFFGKHKNFVKYTTKIGGGILILMGILMFTGKMNGITSYLSTLSANNTVTVEEKADENVKTAENTEITADTTEEMAENEETSTNVSANEETTA